jgi:CDP-glycerol glycerophosphotransferase
MRGARTIAGVPRISVIVPIYDVEDYLEECLGSLAAQSHEDFEAILVDDGSTDSSAAIAAGFCSRDGRFRLLRQPNGGLSRARNAGAARAEGEYLAFLDSDDVLPPEAYARLVGSLERTGSDFAGGNVHRLSDAGAAPAPFLATTFARTRERTHVTRFAPLLADRTAWNKLWRRSFWTGNRLRFPEGRLHEDIPVVLPAHFMARSVDVIAEPVYHWRVREGSITRRRCELRTLRDRLTAVEEVRDYLERHQAARHRRRYERSALAHDLRLHLDLLDEADDQYRAEFMDRANAFLQAAGDGVCDGLAAVERVKWHLIRQRRLPELLQVLRDQRAGAITVRCRGRRHYAQLPGDAPEVPRAALRLRRRDPELALSAHLEDLHAAAGGRLRLAGHAYVNGLGAVWPEDQDVELAVVQPGRARAVRMRLAPQRLATIQVRRRDLPARLGWAGFEATFDPLDLPEPGVWEDERWELFANVRVGAVRRRRARFSFAEDVRTLDLPTDGTHLTRVAVGADGAVRIERRARWLRVERHRAIAGTAVELAGSVRVPEGARPQLELTRAADRSTMRFPLNTGGFAVQIPLGRLRDADWLLGLRAGDARLPVGLGEREQGAVWRTGGRELELSHGRDGLVRLSERAIAPVAVPADAERSTSTGRQG